MIFTEVTNIITIKYKVEVKFCEISGYSLCQGFFSFDWQWMLPGGIKDSIWLSLPTLSRMLWELEFIKLELSELVSLDFECGNFMAFPVLTFKSQNIAFTALCWVQVTCAVICLTDKSVQPRILYSSNVFIFPSSLISVSLIPFYLSKSA